MSRPQAFYGAWGLPPLPAAPSTGRGPRSHRASTKASLCGARQGRMSPGRQPGRHGKASGPLPRPPLPQGLLHCQHPGQEAERDHGHGHPWGTAGAWCSARGTVGAGWVLFQRVPTARARGVPAPWVLSPQPLAPAVSPGAQWAEVCVRLCTILVHTRVHEYPHAQRHSHMCTPVKAFSRRGCAHRHEKAPTCTHNSLSLVHLQICTRVSIHGQAHMHRGALARPPPHIHTPHAMQLHTCMR